MIRTYCDKCKKESELKEIDVYGCGHDFRSSRSFCAVCYEENKSLIKKIMESKK